MEAMDTKDYILHKRNIHGWELESKNGIPGSEYLCVHKIHMLKS